MEYIYLGLSLIKFLLLFYVLSVLRSAVRYKRSELFYVALIAFVYIINELLFVSGAWMQGGERGLNFNTGFIISQTFSMLIASSAVVNWSAHGHYKDKYLKFNVIGFLIFAFLGIALHFYYDSGYYQELVNEKFSYMRELENGKLEKVPDTGGRFILSLSLGFYWIFWVYIYLYYAIMIIFAGLSIDHSKGNYTQETGFLRRRGLLFIIFFAVMISTLVPIEPVHHAAGIVAFAILAAFKRQFRSYIKEEEDIRKERSDEAKVQLEQAVRSLAPMKGKAEEKDFEDELLKGAALMLQARSGALFSQEDDGYYICRAVYGYFPPLLPVPVHLIQQKSAYAITKAKLLEGRYDSFDNFAAISLKRREAILISDAMFDPRVPDYSSGLIKADSVIAAPFYLHEKTYCLAFSGKGENDRFNPEDLTNLKSLLNRVFA